MNVPARLAEHRAGRGSRLCEVAKEREIGFRLVRLWRGDRKLERTLKNRKNAPRWCSHCNGFDLTALDFTLADVPELEF